MVSNIYTVGQVLNALFFSQRTHLQRTVAKHDLVQSEGKVPKHDIVQSESIVANEVIVYRGIMYRKSLQIVQSVYQGHRIQVWELDN